MVDLHWLGNRDSDQFDKFFIELTCDEFCLSFGYDFRPAFEQSKNDAWQDKDDAMDNAQVNVVHSHDHPVLW